jgi:hypothetical protein
MITAPGGIPGETAKGWRIKNPNTYDLEFGFSCMGYEIAGGWGHAMAKKGDGEPIVMVGDGTYLMMNSDIYSTVLTGHKMIVVVCDNGGYAVINRLQKFKGVPGFNNLHQGQPGEEPFASISPSMPNRWAPPCARCESLADLEAALEVGQDHDRTTVISIVTDAFAWVPGDADWDVGVPEVSDARYRHIKNPLLKLARQMVEAGELGEITGFRGIHAEDYMHDPQSPWTWRIDPSGGPGVIADLGSHIIGMARFLLGEIAEVSADVRTVIKQRPVARGASEMKPVEVDDVARILVQFGRGCGGAIEANWIQTGRKMQLGFELTGEKGSLVFTQERLNELLYYKAGGEARHMGFTRIESGPQHEPYGGFCVAGGHQLGFNDLKTIEMAEFLGGIAKGGSTGPDFREAYEIQKVVEAAIASSRRRSWTKV